MRILCYGDSDTYGYDPRSYLGGRYPAEQRWVDQLAQQTGWEVLNGGLNGREIPHSPEEWAQFRQLLAQSAPVDLLVVMLGSNDLLQGGLSAQEVTARMEAFLTRVEHPHICLIAPPPMQPGTWVTEESVLRESVQLVSCYRALAQRLHLPFGDTGSWGIEMLFDGVHFSEAGHRAFTAGMKDVLRHCLPADER